MTIYYGEHGYDYIQAITAAIEQYTSGVEKHVSDAFIYRSENLKYAVERELFTQYCNDESLIKFYNDLRRDGKTSEYICKDYFQNILARNLVKSLGSEIDNAETVIQYNPCFACDVIRNIRRSIFRIIKGFLHRNKSSDMRNKKRIEGVYFVIHEKFINFFYSLYGANDDNAYLALDKNVGAHLFDRGLNGDYLRVSGFLSKNIPFKSELRKFPYLISVFDSLYDFFEKVSVSYVVVPEGDASMYEVINRVCKKLGVPIACIQQGWSPVTFSGTKNMSFDKMFVWGREFSKMLSPLNPDQVFSISGNHIISNGNREPSNYTGKRDGICFFLQLNGALISDDAWNNFISLMRWTAKEFPETPVYIREHPSFGLSEKDKEYFSSIQNIIFSGPRDYSLPDLFARCFLSVAIYSSTILESIEAGILPIIFNENSLPRYYPDVGAAGAGIEINNLDAAKKEISGILQNRMIINSYLPAMSEFSNKYFNSNEHTNARNVILHELNEL